MWIVLSPVTLFSDDWFGGTNEMKCVCVFVGRGRSQGLVFLSSLKCSSVPFIDGREGSVCEWTRGEKHVFAYFCSHIKIRCREEEGEEN